MKANDTKHVQPRRDTIKSHLVAEHRHDPYRAHGKLSEPTVCPECKAVFLNGRWQWRAGPFADANSANCPACLRIQDHYPAGELRLSGGFLAAHKEEITQLIRNTEALERGQHPLQRIMDVQDDGKEMIVTTTDIHLPRRIGHALASAYRGELETHYDETGYFVRVAWCREN